MAENVKTARQSTGSVINTAILPAIMTPLQQTLASAPHPVHERRRVTGCPLFLVGTVLSLVLPAQETAAQRDLPTTTPVLTQSETTSTAADIEFVTGRRFEDALEKKLSLAWKGQNLRDGLRKLGETRQVAILLDRRIDPGQEMSLQVQNVSLKALLNLIANEAGAAVSVTGTMIYIGPPETAARLRTVEEIAVSQLVSSNTPESDGRPASSQQTRRSFELLQRQTLAWSDFTTPRELLEKISGMYSLQLIGSERVPHDLWGEAVVPSATSTQLLVAVLGQFDLSFEWSENRDAIQIIPMPLEPRVERTFTLRRGTETNILSELQQRVPQLVVKSAGRRLTAAGTLEQLEFLESLIHPERSQTPTRPSQRPPGGGITTFTFAADAPLIAFLNTLEKQAGYDFQYDADEFDQAGISLEKRIRLEASELTAEEVFQKMFPPQNIAFRITGKTVYLTPASKPDTK